MWIRMIICTFVYLYTYLPLKCAKDFIGVVNFKFLFLFVCSWPTIVASGNVQDPNDQQHCRSAGVCRQQNRNSGCPTTRGSGRKAPVGGGSKKGGWPHIRKLHRADLHGVGCGLLLDPYYDFLHPVHRIRLLEWAVPHCRCPAVLLQRPARSYLLYHGHHATAYDCVSDVALGPLIENGGIVETNVGQINGVLRNFLTNFLFYFIILSWIVCSSIILLTYNNLSDFIDSF